MYRILLISPDISNVQKAHFAYKEFKDMDSAFAEFFHVFLQNDLSIVLSSYNPVHIVAVNISEKISCTLYKY